MPRPLSGIGPTKCPQLRGRPRTIHRRYRNEAFAPGKRSSLRFEACVETSRPWQQDRTSMVGPRRGQRGYCSTTSTGRTPKTLARNNPR